MKIDIKHRTTSRVLFSATLDNNTVKKTLEIAVKEGTDLSGASLSSAKLSCADLTGANLTDADLTDADLRRANLSGANLSDAYLSGANLAKTKLTDANLSGAKLADAKLSGANLINTKLTGAKLYGSIINDSDKVILTSRWIVIVSSVTMRIGCQKHTHEKWRNFTDEQISEMDENALTFWRSRKETLLSVCGAQNLTEGG